MQIFVLELELVILKDALVKYLNITALKMPFCHGALLTRTTNNYLLKKIFTGLFYNYYIMPYIYIHKEGNVLFNDALNTFYLWLYGVTHMVKDHSD